MFNFSLTELLLIFIVALVVFGPKRLPEIGAAIGRGLGEFRRALQDVKQHMDSEISSLDETRKQDPDRREHHDTPHGSTTQQAENSKYQDPSNK